MVQLFSYMSRKVVEAIVEGLDQLEIEIEIELHHVHVLVLLVELALIQDPDLVLVPDHIQDHQLEKRKEKKEDPDQLHREKQRNPQQQQLHQQHQPLQHRTTICREQRMIGCS